MNSSIKHKVIKKKHKKKKLRLQPTELQPIIKPECFDGSSNWIRMQKVFDVSQTERSYQSFSKTEALNSSDSSHHKRTSKLNHNNLDTSHYSTYEQAHWPKSEHVKFKKKFTEDLKRIPNSGEQQKNSKAGKETNTLNSAILTFSPSKKSEKEEPDSSEFKFNFGERESSSNQVSHPNSQLNSHNFLKDNIRLTRAIAMDCEMVGTGPTGKDSVIARVSIVNSFGECLYDEHVKPREKITDYRTRISGVRASDLSKGKELYDVQREVLSILEGRKLVGHSIKHDLDVLFISHPRSLIRDTADYKPFRELCNGRTPSLKKLCSMVLGVDIQSGEHSSIEDAQAAMLLYLKNKHQWEKQMKSFFKRKNTKKVCQSGS